MSVSHARAVPSLLDGLEGPDRSAQAPGDPAPAGGGPGGGGHAGRACVACDQAGSQIALDGEDLHLRHEVARCERVTLRRPGWIR